MMRTSLRRKITASALAIALIVSLLPLQIFAQEAAELPAGEEVSAPAQMFAECCSPTNPHSGDLTVNDGETHYYVLSRGSNMTISNAEVTGWTWEASPTGMFVDKYPQKNGDTGVKFRTTATPGTAVFTGTTATGTITVTIITGDPGGATPEHVHAWSDAWTSDATHHWHACTAADCDVADNASKDGYAEHTQDAGTVTKEPTETEAGEKTYKCSVCEYVLRTETIPATGTGGDDPQPPTPATCPNNCSPANPHADSSFTVNDGETHYYALDHGSNMTITNDAVTGWTYTADPEGMFVSGYPQKVGTTGMKFRTTTTPGTAVFTGTTASGTITVTIITQALATHTHVWAETVDGASTKAEDFDTNGWLIATPATCTVDGQMVRQCTAADCTLTTNPETQTIEATGHDWGAWATAEAATCQKVGSETRVCKNDANHTETKEIPQLAHVDSNGDALCDNDCGTVVTTVLEQAIAAATAAKTGVTEAENGSQVPTAATWATPGAFTALNTAISTAQSALETASTAQAVLDAVAALETATTTFNNAAQPGEKASACDCGPLNPHVFADGSDANANPIDVQDKGTTHYVALNNKKGSDKNRFALTGYGTEAKGVKWAFEPTTYVKSNSNVDTVKQQFATLAVGGPTTITVTNLTTEDGANNGTAEFTIYVVDPAGEEVTVTFQGADGTVLDTTTAANRIGKTLTEAAITVPTVTPGEGQALKGWYVVDADGNVTATPWDPDADALKSKTLTLRAVLGKAYQVRYFLMENGGETAKPVPGLSSATAVAGLDADSVTVTAPDVLGYVVVGEKTQTVDLTKAAPGVTFYYQKAYETGAQYLVPADAAGTTFEGLTIAAAPGATLELVGNNAELGLTAAIRNTMGLAVSADGKSLTVDATQASAATQASTVYVKATAPDTAQVTYYYLTVEPPKAVTVTYKTDDGSQNKKPGSADQFDATKLIIPDGGTLSADGTTITFHTYAGAPLPTLGGDYPTHTAKQFAGWNMTSGTLTTGEETYSGRTNIPKAPYEAGEIKLGDTDVTLVTGWRNFKGYLKILAVDTQGTDMHIETLLSLTRQRNTEDYGFKTESVKVNDFDAIQIDFCYDNTPSVDVDLSFLDSSYTLLGFYYKEGPKPSAIKRNEDVKDAGSWQLVTIPSSDAEKNETAAEAPVVNLVLAKAYTVKYHVPEEAGVTMKDNVDEQTFVKEHLPDDEGGRTKVVNDLAVFAESAELLELPTSLDPDRSIVGWYAEDESHYGTSGFIDLTQDLSQLDTDGDRVINLTAKYVRAGKKYITHYDANLPTGLPDGTTAGNMSKDAQGESDTGSFEFTAAAKPTLPGYVFKGWSLNDPSPADDAELIQPGEKLTLDEQEGQTQITGTLYAIWEPSYTVTYTDGVEGEEVFADQTYSALAGEATPAFRSGTASGDPARTGYTFSGWDPTLADTVSGDVTYKATWTLRNDLTYTVNYLEKDTDKVLKAPTTVTGQTFGAEVTVTPAAITGYTAPEVQTITIAVTGNAVTFYYTPIPYTVTYDLNGGVTTSETVTFENQHYGDVVPTIDDPTREGYTFTGWDPHQADTVSGDVTYKATWELRHDLSYTVKYLEQGTNTALHAPKVVENQTFGATVTEQAVDVSGYVTPADQDLTLGAADASNVITFYYTKRADLTYTVNYLEQVKEGEDKVLHEHAIVTGQTYGAEVTVSPIAIEGYVAPEAQTLTIGLSTNVVNFYYTKRADLSYTVNYLEQGTNKVLSPAATVEGQTYQAKVTVTPVAIDGYVAPKAQALTIGLEDNAVTFYYTKRADLSYTVNYLEKDTNEALRDARTINNQTYQAEVAVNPVDIPGYTSPAAQTITIAVANNVVNFYYTPIFYTVEYDVNGGATTSTQSKFENLRYGDATPTIAEPTKAGSEGHNYYFSRWDPVFSDTVTDNVKYTAVWADNQSEYTVTYDLNGGQLADSSTPLTYEGLHYGDNTPTIGEPTKAEDATSTYEFAGWSPAFSATVKGETAYVAQWTNHYKSYNVIYKVGDEIISTVPVVYGSEVTVDGTPTMEGYDIGSWTCADVDISAGHFTMPAQNVTLTASKAPHSYTVTYEVDGETVGTETKDYGATVTVADKYVKEGYDVTDWATTDATISGGAFQMPAKDVTLTATSTVHRYTVTYQVDGQQVDQQTVAYGANVTVAARYVKTGYDVSDWATTDAAIVSGHFTMPAKDVLLTATSTVRSYTVTYKVNGETVGTPETVAYGTTVTVADKYAKTGYTVTDWATTDATISEAGTFPMPAKNVTLTATAKIGSFTLTYVVGEETVRTVTVVYGKTVTVDGKPVIEGYDVGAWTTDDVDISTGSFVMPAKDVTLTASKTPQGYTVAYDLDGDLATTDDQVKFEGKHYGDPTPTVADPTKAEDATYTYTFAGWSPAFSETVQDSVTYVAQWTPVYKNYTVAYDLDGDLATTDDQVKFEGKHYGDPTPTIENPTKADDDTYTYTFAGWSPAVSETVSGAVTYVAQWTSAYKSHSVSYDLAGGALPEGTSNPTSFTPEDPDFTLNNPVRDGYVFDGWTGTGLTEKTVTVTVDTAGKQELTFTANWLVDVLVDDTVDVPDGVTGDGIADKYQVKLIYKAGANGSVTGKTEKVVTLKDGEGNLVERLEDQVPGNQGVTVTANSGYSANGWDPDPTAKMTYVGGQSYEFTAQFKSAGYSGGGSYRPSKPSTPPEEDLDDPDVPLANLPQLNTKDHVAYLIGRTDGTIAPMDNITRGEVATIFFRLLTEESRTANWSTSCGYWDMDGSEYYYNPVSTATKAGLIQGYTDGSFGGNDPITRAEMATIAARFLSEPYSGENLFTDIDGHWAAEYINRAAKAGWFKVTDDSGNSVGAFRPDDCITRAEVVVMINRMLGRKPDRDHLLPDMKTWPDNVDTPATAWYYLDMQEASNSHDYTQDAAQPHESWAKLIANPDWAALERK